MENEVHWEPGVQDWTGAGWPDPSLLVTQGLILGGNFWGLQGLTKPQQPS